MRHIKSLFKVLILILVLIFPSSVTANSWSLIHEIGTNSDYWINSMATDSQGRAIWGTAKHDSGDGEIRYYRGTNLTAGNTTTNYSITFGPNGEMYTIGHNWLYKLNPLTGSVDRVATSTHFDVFSDKKFSVVDKDGTFWAVDLSGKLYKYVNDQISSAGIGYVYRSSDIDTDLNGNIFVTGYDISNKAVVIWGKPGSMTTFTSPDTGTFYVERTSDGNMWLAHSNGKLYRLESNNWVLKTNLNKQIREIKVAPSGLVIFEAIGNYDVSAQIMDPEDYSLNNLGTNGNWLSSSLVTHVDQFGNIYKASGLKMYKYPIVYSDLSVSGVNQTSVTLNINYGGKGVTGILQRSTDNINFTDIKTFTGKTVSDSGLTPGTTYYYRFKFQSGYFVSYGNSLLVKTTPPTPNVSTSEATPLNWHQTEGRGKVVLNWPSVTGATGYKVLVWDGYAYRSFDVGNVTTWDSSVWKIYPTEAQLDSYANNSQSGNLFNTVKGSLDLRDTPNKLYNKTLGTTYNSSNSYYFRVVAYNEFGDSPQSSTHTVNLSNRTDNISPTGTLVINDGSMKTGSNQVTLYLTSNDNASGVTEMSFSNDNISWTSWETFSTAKVWTITSGPGEKRVYVKYRDAAGNISNIVSGSIYLVDDVKPPTVSVEVNSGQAITNTRLISISISAHDDSTELPDLRYRVSADGLNWFNWNGTQWVTGWSSNFNVLDLPNWDVGDEEGVKYVYVQVRDIQGNVSSAAATLMHLKPTSTEKITGLSPTDFDADTGKIILIPESVVDPTNVQGKVLNIKTGAGTSEPMIILGSQVGKLELSGSFAANNITQVRYSINGIIASAWESIPSGSSSIVKHVTFEGQGPQKVSLQFKNSYGVESRWLTMSYFVDTDAPEITDFKALNKATASVTAQQQLTAKDNVSKDLKYRTKADTGAWSSWSNIPTDGKISVTVASNTSSVIVEVVDLAGNVGSQSLTRPEFTDVTPPEIISLKTKNNASASKNSSIELVVLAKDDLSASLQYSVDGGAWQALPTNGVISANLGSTPGLKHISVTVRDQVGNVSTPQTISVWRVAS